MTMMNLRRSGLILGAVTIGLVFLAACSPEPPTTTPAPTLPAPTPTITSLPPRQLTVCLGQEPASLYPVDNPSSVSRSVLAAVYDGPIDHNSYGFQPVILERLPSLENGDAQLFTASVYIGDEVVDASGVPVTLEAGVKVHPAGCTTDDCSITYDGTSEIEMDQMQVTFNILPGLTWSDGEPLTADDSVYAYQVAADPASTGSRFLVSRTQSYEAADATTIQWWGKPGFIDPTYFTNFWSPLPEHLWSQIPVDQLTGTDASARTPLGWGAYVIQEWLEGDHITLTRNPRYFRAAQGLPRFDLLIFRFVTDPGAAISALLDGSCDLLDPSIPLDGQADLLRSMAEGGQLQALFTTLPVMEELALGIRPVSYDNGIDPGLDRVDYFGDVRVRKALAMCLNRQQVVDEVLAGLSSVPNTYLPSGHPLYNPEVTPYAFDVPAASQLLEQAGWKDVDNDPSTPRQAWGVAGIPAGTKFVLDYVTTNAVQRQQASAILSASLAECGIQVNVRVLDAETLYAQGPAGILFGRSFDLAEFAMGSTGIETPCEWYTSSEIPGAANNWVGTNVSGYSSPEFDAACLASQQALPEDAALPGRVQAYALAQSIFTQDLPVIPLYWRVRVAAARADLCNFSLDSTASSSLWGVEEFSREADCQP
jgi:peptide/nickel transport system substrate-binding protein